VSGYFQIQAPQTPQKQRRAAALKTKRLLRLITNSSAQKAKRFGAESLLRVGHLWLWIGFLKGGLVFAEERLNPRELRFHGFA